MLHLKSLRPVSTFKPIQHSLRTPKRWIANQTKNTSNTINIGDTIHGYRVLEKTEIPERNLHTIKFEHLSTGAKHFHVDCADTNNAFGVTFKTIPKNSTGVAHILEHTVLCGSKKYPVRDPFFNMLKRSLNTYMNAETGFDYTSYPFSTQNEKDYYNLLSVYLDATFFPLLKKFDFMQEGHRLEFENLADPSSKLQYKGIVYNEMKGAMSDPSSLFHIRMLNELYPTDAYAHNSGGDPKNIPELTYEQLVDFHKTHYHPSNATFYTYGTFPVEKHLEFIDKNVLNQFEKKNIDASIKKEPRFAEPKKVVAFGPPTPMVVDPEKDTKVCMATLTNPISDSFTTFSLSILSSLLLNGPKAPLYKALIESNIALSFSPYTGYEAENQETSFGIGVVGIRDEEVEQVEQIINDTLKQSAEEGFESARIESIIHQLELSQKNITTGFGLSVLGHLNKTVVHNAEPTEGLRINKHIERLRDELKKGPFFQSLIKKYLLDNNHKVTLVMKPDPAYGDKLAQEERAKLDAIQSKLTEADKQQIVSIGKQLKEQQEKIQDPSVLPTLTMSDIPREGQRVDLVHKKSAKNPATAVKLTDQKTNGIAYFTGLLDIPQLPEDLVPYVPLFCQVLGNMGTKKQDHRDLSQNIELYTGGISTHQALITNHSDMNKAEGIIELKSLALERNVSTMFELMQEILSSTNFKDTNLLKSLVGQITSGAQDSLNHSGSSFAVTYATSPFRKATQLKELWSGISHVTFMQQLAQQESLDDTVEKLQQIAEIVLNHAPNRCLLIAENNFINKAENMLDQFLAEFPSKRATSNIVEPTPNGGKVKSYFALPGSVNYVAKATESIPWTHPDSPKLLVLAQVLDTNFLHKEIREKGGAYGAGTVSRDGLLGFYSYRDPNVDKTLNIFDSAVEWVKNAKITDRDLEEAKLSIFSDIDAPLAPSQKGALEFLTGVTYEMRQLRRERLFAVNRDDLVEVAQKYLNKLAKEGSISVFGSSQNEQAITQDSSWEFRSLVDQLGEEAMEGEEMEDEEEDEKK